MSGQGMTCVLVLAKERQMQQDSTIGMSMDACLEDGVFLLRQGGCVGSQDNHLDRENERISPTEMSLPHL